MRSSLAAVLPFADPAPGSGVTSVFTAGQTEMSAAVPLILVGLVALLGLGWVIRSAFIAQKVAKKAASQIG